MISPGDGSLEITDLHDKTQQDTHLMSNIKTENYINIELIKILCYINEKKTLTKYPEMPMEWIQKVP